MPQQNTAPNETKAYRRDCKLGGGIDIAQVSAQFRARGSRVKLTPKTARPSTETITRAPALRPKPKSASIAPEAATTEAQPMVGAPSSTAMSSRTRWPQENEGRIAQFKDGVQSTSNATGAYGKRLTSRAKRTPSPTPETEDKPAKVETPFVSF